MSGLACRWLFDGICGPPRENVTLEIDSGRISAVSAGGGGDLFVMPAFVDAHCHFTQMAAYRAALDLSDVESAGELLALVSDAPDGRQPIRGEGFDESRWSDPRLPSLQELDAASAGRPLFLRRVCCHMALMSTAMMDLYGDCARIDRATGVATEDPVLSYDKRFPPSEEEIVPALRLAAKEAHAVGVTGMCSVERLGDASRIGAAGLPLDISCAVLAEDLDRVERGHGLLGVKCFLDGSIGAGTAAMNSGQGRLLYEDDELLKLLSEAWRLGLPPVLHAIGGRAVAQAASIGARAVKNGGVRADRWVRIEHAEELLPALDHLRSGLHRICAQPNFVSSWQGSGGLYESRLGPGAAGRLNPFATLTGAGLELGFGSDCMPFGPLKGLDGALLHPDPSQRIGVARALRAYTLDAALLAGLDELARPVEPGRAADLVALSNNPFLTGSVSGTEVVGVLRRGEPVYGFERGTMA